MTTFTTRHALVAALAAFAACTVTPAVADDDDLPKMRAIAGAAKLISLEDASARALEAKPGTIVDAELERRFMNKGYDYEFEVIDTEGQSWDVLVDGRDGKVRSVSQDWFD
jgi:uncharacterized membrane protein YkoI